MSSKHTLFIPKLDEIKILLHNQPNIDIFAFVKHSFTLNFLMKNFKLMVLILYVKTDQVMEVAWLSILSPT